MRLGVNRDHEIAGNNPNGMNRWSYTTGIPGANGMHYNTRMEVAQDIANQLTAMDLVQSANVLLSDRNAYIAVSTKDGSDPDKDSDVTMKIAQNVQAVRPNINHVYVSADPYFVRKANTLRNDLIAGKPVSGLLGEFNMIVQKLFPINAVSRPK